jgi:hypothetical protein
VIERGRERMGRLASQRMDGRIDSCRAQLTDSRYASEKAREIVAAHRHVRHDESEQICWLRVRRAVLLAPEILANRDQDFKDGSSAIEINAELSMVAASLTHGRAGSAATTGVPGGPRPPSRCSLARCSLEATGLPYISEGEHDAIRRADGFTWSELVGGLESRRSWPASRRAAQR